jgi:AcrR family transcriptional regulator
MTIPVADAAELRTRDAGRTQRALLDAATAEFSEHGLEGARIDRIAEHAGVNKRLIYYYFGGKDELFFAVLKGTYAGIRSAERALDLINVKPAEAIRRLIEFTWTYYLEHPEFLALLNAENMCAARHLKGSKEIREVNSPLPEWLGEVLERGRTEGVFRGGVDPIQLYLSIAGQAYFYLSNKHTLSTSFGRDLMSPRALAERLSHMTEVILGYLLID